jgi:hypothetical protein
LEALSSLAAALCNASRAPLRPPSASAVSLRRSDRSTSDPLSLVMAAASASISSSPVCKPSPSIPRTSSVSRTSSSACATSGNELSSTSSQVSSTWTVAICAISNVRSVQAGQSGQTSTQGQRKARNAKVLVPIKQQIITWPRGAVPDAVLRLLSRTDSAAIVMFEPCETCTAPCKRGNGDGVNCALPL